MAWSKSSGPAPPGPVRTGAAELPDAPLPPGRLLLAAVLLLLAGRAAPLALAGPLVEALAAGRFAPPAELPDVLLEAAVVGPCELVGRGPSCEAPPEEVPPLLLLPEGPAGAADGPLLLLLLLLLLDVPVEAPPERDNGTGKDRVPSALAVMTPCGVVMVVVISPALLPDCTTSMRYPGGRNVLNPRMRFT